MVSYLAMMLSPPIVPLAKFYINAAYDSSIGVSSHGIYHGETKHLISDAVQYNKLHDSDEADLFAMYKVLSLILEERIPNSIVYTDSHLVLSKLFNSSASKSTDRYPTVVLLNRLIKVLREKKLNVNIERPPTGFRTSM